MHQGNSYTKYDPLGGNQKGTQPFFIYQDKTQCASHQAYCREVEGYKYLPHPNVLPVIEVSETLFPLCIMSPWMPDGNIMQYTHKNRDANRLMLVRIHQN